MYRWGARGERVAKSATKKPEAKIVADFARAANKQQDVPASVQAKATGER